MKGLLVIYLNTHPDLPQSVADSIKVFMDINAQLLARIKADGRFVTVLIPTMSEACRVERICLDEPFPRFAPRPPKKPKAT